MLKLHIVLDATLVGAGEMNIGKVSFEGGQPIKTEWEPPIHVSPGDIFNIPQGYAHCLKNTSDTPLLIAFVCAPEHLTTDRYLVENL